MPVVHVLVAFEFLHHPIEQCPTEQKSLRGIAEHFFDDFFENLFGLIQLNAPAHFHALQQALFQAIHFAATVIALQEFQRRHELTAVFVAQRFLNAQFIAVKLGFPVEFVIGIHTIKDLIAV